MRIADQVQTGLIDLIEWTEDSTGVMVWRFPMHQHEVKYGAKLTVRDYQEAFFYYNDQPADVYRAGLYTLTKENMPRFSILSRQEFQEGKAFTPEIFFVKTKFFIDEQWSLPKPIMIRDHTFGSIKVYAYGVFDVKITDAQKVIKKIASEDVSFSTKDVGEIVSKTVLSLLPDALSENKFTQPESFDHYEEISEFIQESINTELSAYGLMIKNLVIKTKALGAES
jgi:membrane protease subunit (stomatin/prohibitin family)